MLIRNFWLHFYTVSRHKSYVFSNCFHCGIIWRGLLHDLSKFSPVEFFAGVKYFQGTRSPNEKERELFGYSKAWMHHKGRNRHHFEYWTDYNIVTKKMEAVNMPTVFIIEMFCDRVAASKIYMKDKYTDNCPLEYFLSAKSKRRIHPETSDLLEKFLTILAEKGEKETFKYIKSLPKK